MPQSYHILECLQDNKCKDFIINNIDEDVQKMALRFHGKLDFDLKSALEYIRVHQKARRKLPELCKVFGAMTDRAYQQSSSEAVAQHRAVHLKGKALLDLTGGLGVDDMALARSFEYVRSCDPDERLNALVRYNLNMLNISNIDRIEVRAEDVSLEGFDWIFLDPDRRPGASERVVGLAAMQPDVLALCERMPAGQSWAVKLSPLFDLDLLVRELPDVYEVQVISENDEVKEVFAICVPKSGAKKLVAVNLGRHPYLVEGSVGQRKIVPDQGPEPHFLHLPMAALRKAGMDGYSARSAGMYGLGPYAVYGSADPIRAVGFRSLQILHRMPPSMRKWKKYIQEQGIKALRIHAKGHARKGAYWASELGVNEGGEDFLVLLFGKEPMGYHCRLLG